MDKEINKILAALEIVSDYSYGAITCPVPKELRDYILKELAPDIPEKVRINDKDETLFGIEPNSHITVFFGVTDINEAKEAVVHNFKKSISVKTTGKIEYFDNEESVAYLAVESPELVELHNAIAKELPNKSKGDEYIPHITVCYLEKGKRLPQKEGKEFSWIVKEIAVSNKEGQEEWLSTEGESTNLVEMEEIKSALKIGR